MKPSKEDEEAFMANLLSGIDSSFFDITPVNTPKKPSLKAIPAARQERAEAGNFGTKHKFLENTLKGTTDEIAYLLEGSEDWDWDVSLSPVKPESTAKSSKIGEAVEEDAVFRCIVRSVDVRMNEKVLHVASESKAEERYVILMDDWFDTDVREGDTLNIIGQFDSVSSGLQTTVVSAKSNKLILHPDILLTATAVASAVHCPRKSLLSLLVRKTGDVSPDLIWGNMLHEIMQMCLVNHRWDMDYIKILINEAIRKGLPDLMKIGLSVEEARGELTKRADGITTFGKKYIGETPKCDAILTNSGAPKGANNRLAISELYDVEEDIWVPKYGLRGKLDATIHACIEESVESHKSKLPINVVKKSFRMPLEIKTGRATAGLEHRAQTMLYSLLIRECYRRGNLTPSDSAGSNVTDGPGGLLYYTKSEEIIHVPTRKNELRGLIMTRNEIAGHLMKRVHSEAVDNQPTNQNSKGHFLPPTIDQAHACARCYVSDTCMLYRKAVEGVKDYNSPIADLYRMKTAHLSSSHLEFFYKWEHLITLEEQDILRFRKELWTVRADEREKQGRCLSSMVLDLDSQPSDRLSILGNSHICKFQYQFRRHTYLLPSTMRQPSPNLLNGHLATGEAVIISGQDNPRLLALARGFVLELSPDKIVVGVDHALSRDYIRGRADISSEEEVKFRIDKDEMTGGMSRIRDNLSQLFYASASHRRLELIVDLRPPTFTDGAGITEYALALQKSQLNSAQAQALSHVLRVRDYALILGMPGTGKTTTIVEIIKILVHSGKTVLLSSYTHSAVDTILLKLKKLADFKILRLGNLDKIHPDIHELALGAKSTPDTLEEYEQLLLSPPVVAATALSTDHPLFSKRHFDYCIIDEASQITLPTSLGPLRFTDKFVLVGDHFQLPPLVKSRAARKGGFDMSLFRRLANAHPHAVVELSHQYRMNEDIMLLANKLVYCDRLKCGSEEVASRTLKIPYGVAQCSCRTVMALGQNCWVRQLMEESCKVVFVDTDCIPAMDSCIGDLIQNEVEASLVQQFTEALLNGGVGQDQIGIISLYRQQIKLLSHLLQEHKNIEILTADRSQGRDKDCIIISLVRANEKNQIGDLLKDWRRINVAFTRARSKLVIFGSRRTLQSSPILSEFFEFMDAQCWVLALSPGADALHAKHSSAMVSRLPMTTEASTAIPSCAETGLDTAHTALLTTPRRPEPGIKRLAKRHTGGSEPMFLNSHQSLPLLEPEKDISIIHPETPPRKKVKKARIEEGLKRSRPILRDLVNDTL